MMSVVKEKLAIRALDKFGNILSEWLKKDEKPAEGEGEKKEEEEEAEKVDEGAAKGVDESGLNKTKMRR